MKTCPVCSAKAFDDARICYGCMHSFEAEAQRTKEPSPLDTTTLDWLAPENLRPLSQASEDGWISGNDLPPWIETYKDDLDLDDAPLVEEGMHSEQLSQQEAQQDKAASVDVALYEEDAYESSYEVPLEVYAELYADAMGDTQSNALIWPNNIISTNMPLCKTAESWQIAPFLVRSIDGVYHLRKKLWFVLSSAG